MRIGASPWVGRSASSPWHVAVGMPWVVALKGVPLVVPGCIAASWVGVLAAWAGRLARGYSCRVARFAVVVVVHRHWA